MATSVATAGFGTLLKAGNGASAEVFTALAEVKSIRGPELLAEIVDITHMSSPGGYREKLATLLDTGPITFDVNFLPGTAAQKVISTDLAAKTKRNFKLEFTDTGVTTWAFSGYYTSLSPSAEIDGVLSASVEVTVTGAVAIS
jgi:predicted secreted protein